MTDKPRNRIVVFRLTQDEYRLLREACDRAGGRNLSDFTRSEVLVCLQANTSSRPWRRHFQSLEQRLAAMQFQLNNLLEGVLHAKCQP